MSEAAYRTFLDTLKEMKCIDGDTHGILMSMPRNEDDKKHHERMLNLSNTGMSEEQSLRVYTTEIIFGVLLQDGNKIPVEDYPGIFKGVYRRLKSYLATEGPLKKDPSQAIMDEFFSEGKVA